MGEETDPLSPDEVAAMFLSRSLLTAESHVRQRQREVEDAAFQLNRAEAFLSDAHDQLDAIRLIKARMEQ